MKNLPRVYLEAMKKRERRRKTPKKKIIEVSKEQKLMMEQLKAVADQEAEAEGQEENLLLDMAQNGDASAL
jgi:hypothetical protein